jgi:N-acetylmuramoyl-L-alanine amidase
MFAAIAGVALLAAALPVAAMLTSPTATVNTGRLNVREGPGAGYLAVATVSQGDGLELVGRNPDASWAQVRIATGQVGWVSTYYILTYMNLYDLPVTSTVVEPHAYVWTGRLNMRTGPGTGYPIIATLTEYDTIAMVGRSADGNWLLIRWSGLLGWANAGFIAASVPTSTLTTYDPMTQTSPPAGPVPHYGTGLSIPQALTVYQSPSITAPAAGTIPSGTSMLLVGRDATAGWVKIFLPSGTQGWVISTSIGTSIYATDLPVLAQ